MNNTHIIANQSLLDIALQEGGDVRMSFDIAMENDLSISEELQVGQELNLPASELINNDILNYYKNRAIRPATYKNEANEIQEFNYQFPLILPAI